MARPDIIDNSEFRLPSTGRHEFAHLADLLLIPGGTAPRAPGAAIHPGPPMKAIQRNGAEGQQAQCQGQRKRLSRESPSDRPAILDHLVGGDSARRKADVDRHHFAFAARSVAKGWDLGALCAGGSKCAGNGGVGAASGALDVAELGWNLHRRAELRDRGAEALQHWPAQRRTAVGGDHGTSDGVVHDHLRRTIRGHHHGGEAIVRVDRGRYGSAFDGGCDVRQPLDILAIANQVFAGLEFLR